MNKRRGGVSLSQVMGKYWELANLDPEVTKGSIAGQLKALDALYGDLSSPEGTPAAAHPPGVYRSAWMGEPGREN